MSHARSEQDIRSAGYDPTTGEWNDSLTGDYLWSNVNVSEAVPDVMTPSTWALWQIYYYEASPIQIPGDHRICGNICGRPYINLGLLVSLYRAVGRDIRKELHSDMVGSAPPDLDITLIPFSAFAVIRTTLPGMLQARRHVSRDKRQVPEFVAVTPGWCQSVQRQIRETQDKAALVALWRERIRPYFVESCWLLRGAAMLFADPATTLHRDLVRLIGEADANALLSNLAGHAAGLESLGPLIGLAKVARGEMRREAYLERYGHRGPHEMELSSPGPEEDPHWLDRQLDELAASPVDVETLLARQRAEYAAAWQRFVARYPRKVKSIQKRISSVAAAARTREAVRSEVTRITRTIRQFLLRAGEQTGLGDGIFFLSLEEMVDVLSGDTAPIATLPARRETYRRYCALPPYPALINGPFDPFRWAADPDRRSDIFDAHAGAAIAAVDTIAGFAGAAGCVEGKVRRLDSSEEGSALQPGEILVTVTTNVGWTPLFPRAAAIVTDVGAPLSHAAIVARELGIPAVVGCGNATMCLKTGDRVRVDGGRGIVVIL